MNTDFWLAKKIGKEREKKNITSGQGEAPTLEGEKDKFSFYLLKA